MATVYSKHLHELLSALTQYRSGRLQLDELKGLLWSTAEIVSSYEERDVRKLLQWAEGKLDMVQFTTDAENVFAASLEIVAAIEQCIRAALDDGE